MPKPMPIILEVEEIAFGAVFRKLRNMEGVVSIDLEGDPEDAKPAKGNVPRYRAAEPTEDDTKKAKRKGKRGSDKGGDSLRCRLLDYINEAGRACPSSELQLLAEECGFAPSTYANVAYGLQRNKLGKRTKHGWVLTAKGKKYLATECKVQADE